MPLARSASLTSSLGGIVHQAIPHGIHAFSSADVGSPTYGGGWDHPERDGLGMPKMDHSRRFRPETTVPCGLSAAQG